MKKQEMMEKLELIEKYNNEMMEDADYDQSNAKDLAIFEFDEIEIYDPFLDENGMFEIENPIEHYGEEKIKEMIEKFDNLKK